MIENVTNSIISTESESAIVKQKIATLSTVSAINKGTRNFKSTPSFSFIATKSIATRSLIQGDLDIYGNSIEYDPDAWVGEDNIVDDNVNVKNIFSIQNENEIGVLDISLSDELRREKSNILVSLIDEGYNVSNIYIYYRNDYHEKVNLTPGKYTVNNIVYLANNNIELKSDIKDFIIEKDDTINLHIEPNQEQITISTISETNKKTVDRVVKNNKIPIFIYLVIVVGIVILALIVYTFVKRIINKGDE